MSSLWTLPPDVKDIIFDFLDPVGQEALCRESKRFKLMWDWNFSRDRPPVKFIRLPHLMEYCSVSIDLLVWCFCVNILKFPLGSHPLDMFVHYAYPDAVMWYFKQIGEPLERCERRHVAESAIRVNKPDIVLELLGMWREEQGENFKDWNDLEFDPLMLCLKYQRIDLAEMFHSVFEFKPKSTILKYLSWNPKNKPKWKEVFEWLKNKGVFDEAKMEMFYFASSDDNVELLQMLIDMKYPCSDLTPDCTFYKSPTGLKEVQDWLAQHNPLRDRTYPRQRNLEKVRNLIRSY